MLPLLDFCGEIYDGTKFRFTPKTPKKISRLRREKCLIKPITEVYFFNIEKFKFTFLMPFSLWKYQFTFSVWRNFGLLFKRAENSVYFSHGEMVVYFFALEKSQFTFSTWENTSLIFRWQSPSLLWISVYFFDIEVSGAECQFTFSDKFQFTSLNRLAEFQFTFFR